MEILEGNIPEKNSEWRVLCARVPDAPLANTWDTAVLLAKAGEGAVILVIVIERDTRDQRAAAREAIAKAEADCANSVPVYGLIATRKSYQETNSRFVHDNSIDIIVDDISDPIVHRISKKSCAFVSVRGDTAGYKDGQDGITRILVPTSGGPNSTYALSTLLPLTPQVTVTALYVAPEYKGEHEVALGQDRLRETIEFVDGEGRIEQKLVTAPSVAEGISQEAGDYDLILIGASAESSFDRVLFGDIPNQLVRESKKPVAVMREPHNPVANLLGQISFRLQRVVPRLNLSERTDTYVRIRRGARPNIDFFILIALSTLIAGLGLIANSTAVVIGAMLVAPLMSPIVGTGLAMVLGDVRFLRLALGAVFRGALLAIALGALVGIFQIGEPLTSELSARTQPSILDLLIAVFSGMAAAYALSKSNAAAALPGVAIAAALVPPLATCGVTLTAGYYVQSVGALLLFITNFIAITVAAALVFLILGFRPVRAQKERKEVRARSARVAFMLLLVVSLVLAGTTYVLNQRSAAQARIREVTEQELLRVTGAELAELTIVSFDNGELRLDIVARSTDPISYQQVEDLQEAIGQQLVADGIIDEISLTMTVIRVTELDPLTPPTPTPGPSPTPQPTPLIESEE